MPIALHFKLITMQANLSVIRESNRRENGIEIFEQTKSSQHD